MTTAVLPDSLEETWLEKAPVCEIGEKCDKEATWLVVMTCPCEQKRLQSCDDDRKWLVQVLKNFGSHVDCNLCSKTMISIRWLPL